MRFVGLTGGLGAGKSTALEILARLGAATLSSDGVVHELYGEPAVRDALVEHFGPGVVRDGCVDRDAIGRRVFADAGRADRAWLEQFIWPRVRNRVAEWRLAQLDHPPPAGLGVVEIPLLFEGGGSSAYDATIAVVATDAVRRARLAERGQQLLEERAARQLTQEEKARRATYVVNNDGSLDQLESQLAKILEELRRG
jgi:dephospho-CoA kinase